MDLFYIGLTCMSVTSELKEQLKFEHVENDQFTSTVMPPLAAYIPGPMLILNLGSMGAVAPNLLTSLLLRK